MGALVLLVTLIVLAVWAASAVPTSTPARVPQTALRPTFGASPRDADRVVLATVGGVQLLLPVAAQVTTAIAYHPVDHPNSVPLSPSGDRISGGGIAERVSDVFGEGGEVPYYLLDGNGSDSSSSTSGLDVGAVPGSLVTSPVDGQVTAVKRYALLGRHDDVEVDIQLADDPSLLMVITHLAKPRVQLGDKVVAGDTVLGVVREFPSDVDQALSTYTSDGGDHVRITVLRVEPDFGEY